MTAVLTTRLDIVGPFDLREIATMGFGHRDERSFDGVMRMAFCLDGDYERQVGVEAEQFGDRLELRVQSAGDPLSDPEVEALRKQVARVVSLDHDGEAFHQLCLADPVLARVHNRAPGFRPALFYSPYEAAVWSIISARRARSQGITLRNRMSELYGAGFSCRHQDQLRADGERSAGYGVDAGAARRTYPAPARRGRCCSARPVGCGTPARDGS